MEFDEKTAWAINILIAYAVCSGVVGGLGCNTDCPFWDDKDSDCVVWTDEDIVTAVKWLNGMKGER